MNIYEEDINTSFDDNKIIIWIQENGRKKNTYISGWNIDESLLKEHLKIIKKKKGCNGTIKNMLDDTTYNILSKENLKNNKNNSNIKILHFQGDQCDFVYNYLQNNGYNKNNICIKG